MASISYDKKTGHRRIQFSHPTKGRQTLRLGKVSKKIAENVRIHTERLLSSLHSGQPLEADNAKWIATVSAEFHDRLCRVGLIGPREETVDDASGHKPLDEFLSEYIVGKAGLAANTIRNLEQSRRILGEFFGTDRPLHTITGGDADRFREHLVRNEYAQATVSREVKRARQFFNFALRLKLIGENPFTDVKAGSQVNEARFFYVGYDLTKAILDACPDADWQLIIALCRFGGLRCPTELQGLTWGDIDWSEAGGRVVIKAKKTAARSFPLWRELRPHLAMAFERAEPGAVYVVSRYRQDNANLRTQFLRILDRAGIPSWPRLFQNLRSSRETELAHYFPLHLVCKWIGNSEVVAKKHYLQMTDEDFEKATQIPTHGFAALGCTNLHQETKTAVSPAFARDTADKVPPRGVEPRFSG